MFLFSGKHRVFESTGFLILSAYLFVFIFALSPFQAGIWTQTEPTLLAIFIIATCNAFWLLIGHYKKYLISAPANLLYRLLLAWLAVQYVATLWAPSGWRSWFGAPEIGIGVAWHISVFLCFMLLQPFWQTPAYRKKILCVAAISLSLECLLHFIFFGYYLDEWSPWRPALWPDYLAFMAGYMWVAAYASGEKIKPAFVCCMVVFMYLVLFISNNFIALALFGFAMLATMLAGYPHYPRKLMAFFYPSRTWKALALISLLLPMLWVAGGSILQLFPQDNPNLLTSIAARKDSMGIRSELSQIAVNTLIKEPSHLLIGSGWGNFVHDSFRYALSGDTHFFKNGQIAPNTTNTTASAFHSHNEPLEVLLALGVAGLIIWFAIPFIIIRHVPSILFWGVVPMLAAIVILQYFWFFMPQVLGFQAIALCALSRYLPSYPASEKHSRMFAYVLLALFGLMGWSAHQQYKAIQYGDELFFIPHTMKAEEHDLNWLLRDATRDASRLGASAENFAVWAWNAHFRDHNPAYDKAWLEKFLDAAQLLENSSIHGARYNMLALWLKYKILIDFTDDAHSDLRKKAASTLESSIYRLTRVAPEREDLAATFLVNLADYTNNNAGKQVEILGNILAIYPQHRSALWLLGHIFLTDPTYAEEGKRMIREAKARHVERVYPVTDAELNATPR